jgi:DnaJ-class molecular chaperone
MSDDLKCSYCFGTGQKVEMRPAKVGEKLPPYQRCPSCGGSGLPAKPVRVWRRRKSMRRVVP